MINVLDFKLSCCMSITFVKTYATQQMTICMLHSMLEWSTTQKVAQQIKQQKHVKKKKTQKNCLMCQKDMNNK